MPSKLTIQEGINEDQINELIKNTREDKAIQKFTSDIKRFPNLASFRNWKKKKRLFVLTNNRKKLLGLIWFESKKPPKDLIKKNSLCEITFAIRIYKQARGKGLAKWFMKKVFSQIPDRYIWLSTMYNNKTAINLYKQFGFKKSIKQKERIYMIYEKG